ncbi:acetoin reductase [Pseudomonas sp. NPDC007930]|uniref:acetoin reductase n=1 Tax=Pseudomonas sp. NPDC007930 TaxID=3364417 RepID=UPI0036E461EC
MNTAARVALVTGAGQGIGRAIALRLAGDGFDLALADVKADKLDQVAGEVRALGRRSEVISCDVADREQVLAAVAQARKGLGALNVMVNNAGIAQVAPLLDARLDDVRRILGINLEGVLWGIQAAAEAFRAQGGGGKIINACSIAGHEGYPLLGVYCATKFAVRALTQAAAKELAHDGITVNSYCPGVVGTDMWVEIDRRMSEVTGAKLGESYDRFVGNIALGRAETPEDVAAFVSYLASADANYMTGQSVMIDGGLVYR